MIARAVMLALALSWATGADAQTRRRGEQPRPPGAASPDRRDSVVAVPGNPLHGWPYWQALGQCGGIYFKLRTLYTDIAVRARSVKPDPKVNAEYTKRLNTATAIATVHFVAAERFLINERGLDRVDAIMTYDAKAREAGNGVATIEAAVAAANPCPALYQACHQAHPKMCSETSIPAG